jgi:predicted sulfurtransferase
MPLERYVVGRENCWKGKNFGFNHKIIIKIQELPPNIKVTNDTTKRLMSSPKCRSVEVINNPARPGSNHREVNCINYKQQ